MSYIEDNLIAGEKLIYRAHRSRILFGWPFVILVGASAAFFWSVKVGAALLGIALLAWLWAYAIYASSEFGVTTKRVLVKVGMIQRHSLEIFLTKVEGIGVDQNVPGRIFGYGTIVITGTGGTKEAFPKIAHPFEFRKHVEEQIAAAQASK